METSYKEIYKALIEAKPFLFFSKKEVILELATDASDTAIGAALFQIVDREIRYISFHSRVLHKSEPHYSIPKKELLSYIFHIEFYQHYLLGVHFYL
jgi:hypothetical protein